jgi:hypothetical protein
MVVDVFTIEALLAGLAGGALGAVLGGLPALGLAGLLVVVGEAGDVVAGIIAEQTVANPNALAELGITQTIGLGPALGPHVAFAGGVAAAAYAGRHGDVEAEGPFHPAKTITQPLGSSPDVLLAGGIFGVTGVLLARLAAGLALPVDPVAFAVVLSGIGHRIAFGYPLIGRIEGDLLDMEPFETGARRGEGAVEDRYVVEPWQPAHYAWEQVVGLGLVVGLFGAYVGLVTENAFLAFGIALALVLLRSLGLERIPIVYHVALPASIAALAVPISPLLSIVVGAIVGILAALIGELAARALYAHGDTYLDPAFTSILVTSLLLALLATAGVLDAGAIPYPVP